MEMLWSSAEQNGLAEQREHAWAAGRGFGKVSAMREPMWLTLTSLATALTPFAKTLSILPRVWRSYAPQ